MHMCVHIYTNVYVCADALPLSHLSLGHAVLRILPINNIPDSKVHVAYMGSIWGRQHPGGPHVGPMNIAIWDGIHLPRQHLPFHASYFPFSQNPERTFFVSIIKRQCEFTLQTGEPGMTQISQSHTIRV